MRVVGVHVVFVLLATLAVSRPAPAQASFSPSACGAEQIQPALDSCAWRRYRAADAELNRVYRRATAADTGAVLVALRAAQRAWVRFRDAHCDYVASTYDGGSMQPMQQGACLEEVTRARIGQLREALDAHAAWCLPPHEAPQPTGACTRIVVAAARRRTRPSSILPVHSSARG
jgi:uncharacterized protein YecT (DUF1311 family)